jgi:hypothetical protein
MAFKHFKTEVEKETGRCIKVIRTDNGIKEEMEWEEKNCEKLQGGKTIERDGQTKGIERVRESERTTTLHEMKVNLVLGIIYRGSHSICLYD